MTESTPWRPAWDVNDSQLDPFYRAVGRVAVAAGHCEWAMQRMWLHLKGLGPSDFETAAKMPWSELAREIKAAASGTDDSNVVDVMKVERALTIWRHNILHTSWWLEGGVSVRGTRHPNRGGGMIVGANVTDIERVADRLFDFAHRLGALTPNDGWPVAYFGAPTTRTGTASRGGAD